jgi:hypothetical protein
MNNCPGAQAGADWVDGAAGCVAGDGRATGARSTATSGCGTGCACWARAKAATPHPAATIAATNVLLLQARSNMITAHPFRFLDATNRTAPSLNRR